METLDQSISINVLSANARSLLTEKVKDHTALKIKEYFFQFLEQFDESSVPSTNSSIPPRNGSLPSSLGTHHVTSSSALNLPSSMALSSELSSSFGDLPIASGSAPKVPFYLKQLGMMKNESKRTLFVNFAHLLSHNDMLARAIMEGYYRFEPYLRQAVSDVVEIYHPDYLYENIGSRRRRDFWISFHSLGVFLKLRELSSEKIGELIAITGTITRTSEVRPELYIGTFQCNECRSITRGIEQQFKYTEPSVCINPVCGNRSSWKLLIEESQFLNWQKLRIQENSGDIQMGSMPRTLDIIIREDLVERVKAGDKCEFTGTLIVVPDVSQLSLPGIKGLVSHFLGNKLETAAGREFGGFKKKDGFSSSITGLKTLGVRELSYKLSFAACMVTLCAGAPLSSLEDADYSPTFDSFSQEEKMTILAMKNTPNLYQKLVESIAPSIFGHQEIKAGILLMLFGGVHKLSNDNISLRGDINICIVGDPGTAKSQFLKYVTNFLPRSVYTSGKSSSAAGLTASVVKDEETGEFTIEAGALMLADNGICAIDEFDKMDLADQVAIHEAMEQQTISIAKAGIHASLNARTSILAAANPVHGRYDKRKSLRQNISMTAPIMSRFDLFFVVVDENNEHSDYNVARHILSVHRLQDQALDPEFGESKLRLYIRFARTISPRMTADAKRLLMERYVSLRQSDESKSSYRMTVRQLESMIRLSEALARVHLDPWIQPRYVMEAYRLLKSSIIRVESESIELAYEAMAVLATTSEGEKQHLENAENDTTHSHNLFKTAKNGSLQSDPLVKDKDRSHGGASQISWEEYERISNLLIYHLRAMETVEEGKAVQTTNDEYMGLRKSALVEWYLTQIEDELQTEQEYYSKKLEVEAVIERLVHTDCVLLEIEHLSSLEKDQTTVMSSDSFVMVHPNYTK